MVMESSIDLKDLKSEIFVLKEDIEFGTDVVKIYALDAQTIGISSNPPEYWNDESLWQKSISFKEEKGGYTISLPKKLISFYLPVDIELSVDTARKRILVFVNKKS